MEENTMKNFVSKEVQIPKHRTWFGEARFLSLPPNSRLSKKSTLQELCQSDGKAILQTHTCLHICSQLHKYQVSTLFTHTVGLHCSKIGYLPNMATRVLPFLIKVVNVL